MSIKQKFLQAVGILLAISMLVAPLMVTHAFEGEDWVLVKYFNDKMDKANQGDAMAMFSVGQLYERGRGTKQDTMQAVMWYERATENGNDYARARLGIMHYEGIGVPKSIDKALPLIEQAAKASVPNAEYYLGIMYENGEGVKASKKQAQKWYELAVAHGSYRAKSRLQALEKGYIKVGKKKTKSSKPTSKVNLSSALRNAVLDGNWQSNELAAGFLPSKVTSCTKLKKNTIRCMSKQQQRSTGDRIITYITASTLSGFNSRDQFKVKYQNTVLSNTKKGNAIVSEDDDGDYAVATKNSVINNGLGKQKTVHKLECEMEEANRLVCLKNRAIRLTYVNKK